MRALISLLLLTSWFSAIGQVFIGAPPLEETLANADIVCVCLTEPSTSSLPRADHATAQDTSMLEVIRAYKGSAVGTRIEVHYQRGEFGLRPGTRYLIGADQLVNSRQAALVGAFNLPQEFPHSRAAEFQSFEDDLDSDLQSADAERLPLLELLNNFSQISDRTAKVLNELVSSDNMRIALQSAVVLMSKGKGSPQLFSAFINMLRNAPVSEWPNSKDAVAFFVAYANTSDEAALESLATGPRADIRYASLYALRKLADPNTTEFFLKELDSSDSDARYQALISLADIWHKYGDYAPGMGPFDKDPQKYIRLWKDLLQCEGGVCRERLQKPVS